MKNLVSIIENLAKEIFCSILQEAKAKSISNSEMNTAIERLPGILQKEFPNIGYKIKRGRNLIEPFTLLKTYAIKPEIISYGDSYIFAISLGDYYDPEKMPSKAEAEAVAKYVNDIYMKRRGWYVSTHKVSGGKLLFTIMPEGANQLKSTPSKLFHITDTKNTQKISSQGLKPRASSSPDRRYTSRVYIFTDPDLVQEQIKQNIEAHSTEYWFPKLTDTLDVSVVEIDTNKLRKGTKFYKDPEFSGYEGAYYTYTHIPPEAISAIRKV